MTFLISSRIVVYGQYWGASRSYPKTKGLTVDALDPMIGLNFLRFVEGLRIYPVMLEWTKWCRNYGIDSRNFKRTEWFDFRQSKQILILAAMDQIFAEEKR